MYVHETLVAKFHLWQFVWELVGSVGIGLNRREEVGGENGVKVFCSPLFVSERLFVLEERMVFCTFDHVLLVLDGLDVDAVLAVGERHIDQFANGLVGDFAKDTRSLGDCFRLFDRGVDIQPLVLSMVFGRVVPAVEEQGVFVVLFAYLCIIDSEAFVQDFLDG